MMVAQDTLLSYSQKKTQTFGRGGSLSFLYKYRSAIMHINMLYKKLACGSQSCRQRLFGGSEQPKIKHG